MVAIMHVLLLVRELANNVADEVETQFRVDINQVVVPSLSGSSSTANFMRFLSSVSLRLLLNNPSKEVYLAAATFVLPTMPGSASSERGRDGEDGTHVVLGSKGGCP
ncbi:UNVERIFIED_CONTAM: hypothetical protein Sradi_6213200 [Sesamum radiatum]|uniref:Uncharacterized protein n=1 Tax=Sesamum radiatum TaxID=300843 RepID=A0AAW2K9C1_SESRA